MSITYDIRDSLPGEPIVIDEQASIVDGWLVLPINIVDGSLIVASGDRIRIHIDLVNEALGSDSESRQSDKA